MRCLIFKVNQLGDNVVFLPALQALIQRHPDWEITVATSPLAAPLFQSTLPQVRLLIFPTPDFNASWKHPAKLLRHALTVRATHPQLCLLSNDQGNVAHLLARLSGASLRVGPLNPHRPLTPLLTHLIPLDPTATSARHNWLLVSELLRHAGLSPLDGTPPPPDLSAFGRDSSNAIVIHPEASRAYQRWPLPRFVALANQLARSHPVTWISHLQPPPEGLSPHIGLLHPPDLATLIRHLAGARLFIGNNSGPMHLASALGIPSVIPCGPSALNWDPEWHRDRFDLLRQPLLPCQPCDTFDRPAGTCQNTAQPFHCLERWSIETVLDRALHRLSTSAA